MCAHARSQFQGDMKKFRGELSEKERELLMTHRASGDKASHLPQMGKMLQETNSIMDKKTETGTEKHTHEDNMGLYRRSLCVCLIDIDLPDICELSLIIYFKVFFFRQCLSWRRRCSAVSERGVTLCTAHSFWKVK